MKPRRQAKTITAEYTEPVSKLPVRAKFTRVAKWQQVDGPISTGPFYTTKSVPNGLFMPDASYLYSKEAPAIPFMYQIEN